MFQGVPKIEKWLHLDHNFQPLSSCENFQDARAVLGRLEYQRDKIEGALSIFEGIDFQAAIEKLPPPPDEKVTTKKGRSRTGSIQVVSHPAGPLLEALYLKVRCLQKLGRVTGSELLQYS